MIRPAIILIVAAALLGCEASAKDYRGISSSSTCASVYDAELRSGAKLISERQESGASGPVHVRELEGSVDGLAVRIEIACRGAELYMASFSTLEQSDAAASSSFDKLQSSAAKQLGLAHLEDGAHGRRATFGCKPTGTSVVLVEDLVSKGANKPGAALLVVPRPGAC